MTRVTQGVTTVILIDADLRPGAEASRVISSVAARVLIIATQ